ncbi:hypothetical protein ACQCSX_04175 [Pseudarthrobacter sp. P1]|uniref:hypothetical protein n=1 Tax=Pseudarthrobacter sp. P1 TaxID=3418418 RepID=UPI003CEAE20F
MSRERLYRVQITEYPEAAWGRYKLPNGELSDLYLRTSWQPAGWESMENARDRDGNPREFWWPSTSRTYASRSAAVERAALIESYGATAVVLETETAWIPLAEANALRKRRRVNARIATLQAEIEKLAAA